MDIVCRKGKCRYNDAGKCERKNLSIDKSADCADVDIDINKPAIDKSKNMFILEPDYAPYKHSKNIDIKCDCESCLFNKASDCLSNGIIVGADAHPPCYSYMPK